MLPYKDRRTFPSGIMLVSCVSSTASFIQKNSLCVCRVCCGIGRVLLSTPAVKYHRYMCLNMLTLEDGAGAMLPPGRAELTLGDDIEKGHLPDVVVETKMLASADPRHSETYLSIAVQVFIPFLIAGFGMVGAGLVLDVVQVSVGSTEILGTCDSMAVIRLSQTKVSRSL